MQLRKPATSRSDYALRPAGERLVHQAHPGCPDRTVGLRGFTMLEVLIVVAILALLATIIVPRVLDHQDRVFNLACDKVSDLLTMFALRDSRGGAPVGIMYDPDRRWLMVLVYDAEDASGREAQWRFDPAIQPVKFPEGMDLLEIRADGRPWDTTAWPLAGRPGHDRPAVEIILEGPSRIVSIVLPPYAVAPRQFEHGDIAMEAFTPLDLTTAGRSREEW